MLTEYYTEIIVTSQTETAFSWKLSIKVALTYWWKKSKRTQIDGEIYQVHGLEESIQWQWVYYPKQSIDSMQSLSSYQRYSSQS